MSQFVEYCPDCGHAIIVDGTVGVISEGSSDCQREMVRIPLNRWTKQVRSTSAKITKLGQRVMIAESRV